MDEVIAVSTDLFFASRIQSAASAAGTQLRFVPTLDALPAVGPSLALVDLDAAVDVLGAIERLRAAHTQTIVAFGPHVDTEKRKAARDAGAHRVMAKSKFVAELPKLMASVSMSGHT